MTDYPRPMLQRSDWLSLDGDWDYAVRRAVGDVAADPVIEPNVKLPPALAL